MKIKEMLRFFSVNGNLFIRSVCFLFIYVGFTSLSAKYGDTQLAVSTIIMKLLMFFSFFIDGFAYAGEALTGRYIGEQNSPSLHLSTKVIFRWCLWIAVVATVLYVAFSRQMVALITDNQAVIEASKPFWIWLWLMPALSTPAFVYDGIYIGAIATKRIMYAMILSVMGFFIAYYALYSILGIQALYIAYMVHIAVRTLYLHLFFRHDVYAQIPPAHPASN